MNDKQKYSIINNLVKSGFSDIARYAKSDEVFYIVYLLVHTKGRLLKSGKVSKYLASSVNRIICKKEDSLLGGREYISKKEMTSIIVDTALYFDSILVFRRTRSKLDKYSGKSLVSFVLYELYYGLLNNGRYEKSGNDLLPKDVDIAVPENNNNEYDGLDGDFGLFSSDMELQHSSLVRKEFISLLKEYYGDTLISEVIDGNSINYSIRKHYDTDDAKEVDKIRKRIVNSRNSFKAFLESKNIKLGDL